MEGISKQENLQELLKGIAEFCEIRREEGTEHVSLADFLSEVSLLTDQDNDKEEQANKVTMMTVHAAKGLEFRNVFVVGWKRTCFPPPCRKTIRERWRKNAASSTSPLLVRKKIVY